MKKEVFTALNGKEVEILTPENEADELEIERLAAEGKLDPRASFADKLDRKNK